ncbi:hypothetical protein E3Q18_03150 [Wallemia mellicola]|uniref:Uncharacterized protein n=1 Tax=Wallemia mellicola TaxID=1708541 RepID=A0A4T0SMG7_9BASI|nr:hypothetical protein E3Q21_00671 [Wallemia mellicola]TIB91660.1 hypothetical protein E3Q20_00657 [Wallemia mellicola]TIB94244.1 hypothetical protein E3Q19_00459 [Wallemia mellicola]TIB96461.1 hypothetical protein E3Q18_03150 [Wallemia mellicola]TIC20911.1 hypothetical protein E3Q13_00150 [Wallemia mellicola]
MHLDAQDVEAVIAHGSHEQLTACLRVLLENRDTTLNDNKDLNDQLSEYQLELDNRIQAFHECQLQLNDALSDQAGIEEDALSRQVQIELLSSKLQSSERKESDLQRSLQVQLDKFDKDKKSWFETESALRAKVTTLSAKIAALNRSSNRVEATPPNSPSPSSPNSAPIIKSMSIESTSERNTREAALEKSQQALEMEKQRRSTIQRNERTLKAELDNHKRLIEDLRSENESYMLLLQERTFSGDLLDSSVFDSMRNVDDSGIASIAEEPENDSTQLSEDDQDFTPKRRRARRRGPADARKKPQASESPKPLSEENGGNVGVTGPGYDLAAELGRAKLDNTLKSDNKTLKEANKALTTYVSKIIEKIINQEGFEHILASDYKDPEQRESMRLKRSQTTTSSSAGRTSLGGVSDALLNSRKKPADYNTSTVRSRPQQKPGGEKRRSLSIDWSNIGTFFKGNNQNESTAQKLPKQEEDDEDRKERDKLKAEMKKISSESLNADGQFTRFDSAESADLKRRSGSVGSGALANWRKKRAERAELVRNSSGNALADVTNDDQ